MQILHKEQMCFLWLMACGKICHVAMKV